MTMVERDTSQDAPLFTLGAAALLPCDPAEFSPWRGRLGQALALAYAAAAGFGVVQITRG